MRKEHLTLSIIIPHHQDEANLEKLLLSIQRQQIHNNTEIIVISNPPSKTAKDICTRYENVIHEQTHTVGVNHARNIGLKRSTHKIVLFLDSDCEIVDERLLEKHLELHAMNSDATCIGGIYSNTSSRTIDKVYFYNQMLWLFQGLQGNVSAYLIGGHFSCKKDNLEGHLFDENIRFGSSETEFFLRLKRQGKIFRLYPELNVVHTTQLRLLKLVRKLFLQGQGARYLENKLGQNCSEASSNFQTTQIEKYFYAKDMDFWIFLMKESYQKGYASLKASDGRWNFVNILVSIVFDYTLKKSKDFFKDLIFLLRNLQKK